MNLINVIYVANFVLKWGFEDLLRKTLVILMRFERRILFSVFFFSR